MKNFKPVSTVLSIICLTLLAASPLFAQPKKEITVDWIYSKEAIEASALPSYAWLADGTAMLYDIRQPAEKRTFERLNPQTGARTPVLDAPKAMTSLGALLGKDEMPETLPWPIAFNGSGQLALYIFKGDIYVLDLEKAQFQRATQTASDEKSASFSPDGKKLAFVRENDLYVYDVAHHAEKRLTRDGSETRLNGTLSWVYWEEVFGRRDIGYWWSNDSQAIAYLQTDESPVGESYFVDFQPQYPRLIKQRYAKAGTPNPIVRLGVMEIEQDKTTWVDLDRSAYEYLVRVKWLPDNQRLSVQTTNRVQTELDLYLANRADGKARLLLKETDKDWVNLHDDLYFLQDGKHFIWPSERSGYAHLYLYKMDGQLVRQITKGNWAIHSAGGVAFWVRQAVSAIDEKNGWIYFTALEKSSIERHLYRIKFDGTEMQRLTREDGTHLISFSPDARFYFDTYSNTSTMPSLSLHTSAGEPALQVAAPQPDLLAQFDIRYPEQFNIPAADNFQMPAQLLKPKDFTPGKRYPVIVYVYGGPSAPSVVNAWKFANYFDQILSREGYCVLYVDNRSATAISHTLETTARGQMLGQSELNDLLAAVKWLKSQSFVDPDRIGVWGWSGGGTFTLLAMTHSAEFKAGIAVAAVTDPLYYDTRSTELMMKLPSDNPAGYKRGSLVNAAKDLHGRLLLVHGTYDDNVHIQNAWSFADELIKAGKMFDMMIYPMRKHGISDNPARIHLYKTMVEFWKKNL
ncbi:MAG TPA: S9 family peptidase [Pyrinomonadaceae bacterium]|jgi:dipeptidyl-peptidase-4